MRELRLHGRGGQGTVIASKLLAVALFLEGREVQSFPMFGVERRGSPVTAFLRVDDAPIQLRCEIQAPDDLIVLDPTLIGATDITAGLKPGGRILINTDQAPEDFPQLLERFHVSTIDATGIAIRHGLGGKSQPIVNTAILGAFADADRGQYRRRRGGGHRRATRRDARAAPDGGGPWLRQSRRRTARAPSPKWR